MVKAITREELFEKIRQRDDFFLVETLPTAAFEHAHLPGAVNLPPDRVSVDAGRLFPVKSAEIVVYCSSPE